MMTAACPAEIVNQVLASTASTAVRPPHAVNLLPDIRPREFNFQKL